MCVSINDVGVCIHSRKMHGDWAGLWLRYIMEVALHHIIILSLAASFTSSPYATTLSIRSCNTIFFGVGCEYVVSWEGSDRCHKHHQPYKPLHNQPLLLSKAGMQYFLSDKTVFWSTGAIGYTVSLAVAVASALPTPPVRCQSASRNLVFEHPSASDTPHPISFPIRPSACD